MIKFNLQTYKEEFSKFSDFCFITLIFALPFISYPFILNSNKLGQELFLVTIVALWGFMKSFSFLKNKLFKIYSTDIVLILFVLYIVVHYTLFSFFSFGYNYLWVLICFFVLFYLFRATLERKSKSDAVFKFTTRIIWGYCFIESVVALLQSMSFLNAKNEYFKVVGTFINPNFLGVYMVVGLIITLYNFIFFQYKNNIIKLFFLVSASSMLYVLFLTDSRASWMSLVIALLFLILSSEKSIFFLKANKKKAFIILAVLILFCLGCIYFLYLLNRDSVDGRTLIREITISRIKENPIFGNGIFNFTSIYNNTKACYFNDAQRLWGEIKVANYVSTSFNDYLQIIFEIGIVGFFFFAFLFYSIVRKVELNSTTRLGFSMVIIFATLGLFTSVLYNPTAMVFLVWALSLLFVKGKNRKEIFIITNIFYIRCISTVFIILSLIVVVFFCFKTQALVDFKDVLEGNNQRFYYKLSDNRMLLIEDDPYIEFKFGFEKYHEGEESKGMAMMENSIKKLPIPDANFVLANLYSGQKKNLRAEHLLLLNVGIEPFRFEPRENLLKFYIESKQNEKIIKTANEIINLPVKIESKKVYLYKKNAKYILEKYKY